MIQVMVWAVVLLGLLAPPDDDFAERAEELRGASRWTELEEAAAARVAADGDDLRARAYLAVALAGQRRFAEAVGELRAIDAAGRSVDDEIPGFGEPSRVVLETIWQHAWANWTPEFNRRCWGGLFEAFPEGKQAAVPASRLLMAALKLGDEAEAARLAAWFDRKLAAAREAGDPRRILHLYTQAYVRAGAGGERTLSLARQAYDAAWAAAAERYGDGDPAAVERCDLDCDKAFDDLALAAALSDAPGALAFREGAPPVRFEDVTEAAGLGGVRKSRVAAGDYDQDGDPDLCLQGVLMENDDGVFRDVTAERGLSGGAASALFGDPDGDGDLDLLLVRAPHPVLFRNGGRRARHAFEDVTAEVGLDAVTAGATPEGAAWWDMEGDGDLDLYLAVYEGKELGLGQPDLVLENRGDGTFVDATAATGVAAAGTWCGRGVSPADVDGDGRQELFVSNYRLNRNVLLRWTGDGLADVAGGLGVEGFEQQGVFGHTIGSVFGDVDEDGDLDLFSANLAHPRFVAKGFSNLSTLLMNPGAGGRFTDERRARGVRFQETHSDPAFVDVDADGDLDLSITCVYEGVPSALYVNDGGGRFTPVTFGAGAVVFDGWGQAWFDKDDDGDLDVLYASNSGVRLFENGGTDHRWLKVRLEGAGANRFGVGARVAVETDEEPPRRIVRELSSARGTTSQDGFVLHFGLGTYKGRVRVAVQWPGEADWQRRASFCNRTVTMKQPR